MITSNKNYINDNSGIFNNNISSITKLQQKVSNSLSNMRTPQQDRITHQNDFPFFATLNSIRKVNYVKVSGKF